ncbi:hypothetical protein J3459_016444 [Metarhizium acridum]|nr:hypothetical protein J3459_016444 [Metarhizium acridum]
MSFSITPRVFSVLCLAVASVAGQWSGNYNTTSVPRRLDPAAKCWIKSLAQRPYTAIYPNADCRCATTGDLQNEPESLKAYGQKKPNAVTQCLCDPVAGNEADTDGLVVPAPDCWCPAQSLKEKSGLSEAKESQVVPETPPCGASIQQCRDELNKSGHPPKNVCQHLMQYKPTEISEPLKSRLPNCSISSLTEVCKGI